MKFRQALFWDTNPAKIDPKKNARYIIERTLEFGRPTEIGWIFKHYPKQMIRKTLPRRAQGIRGAHGMVRLDGKLAVY